jgi:hypothetical protein
MVLCCSGSFISIFFFCRRKEIFAEKSHFTLKNHIFPKISQNSTNEIPGLHGPADFPCTEFIRVLQVTGIWAPTCIILDNLCKTLLLEEDTNVGGIPDSFFKER